MSRPTIIELRGNGLILTTYNLQVEDYHNLEELARKWNESLTNAWFDPVFRNSPTVKGLFKRVIPVSVLRGLAIEKRSF